MNNMAQLSKEFTELVKPLMEFMYKNFDPNTSIIISNGVAKLCSDQLLYSTLIQPMNQIQTKK